MASETKTEAASTLGSATNGIQTVEALLNRALEKKIPQANKKRIAQLIKLANELKEQVIAERKTLLV